MSRLNTAERPSAESRKSSTIGSYTIQQLLGHGPMGMTYVATHNTQKRRVALRVLPPLEHQDRRMIARFAKDVSIASDLKHPNVVRVTDFGEEEGTHFIAMEIVDGRDLRAILQSQGRLPVGAACEIARQTAAGLQAVHEYGLVHRDIQPGNLMVTEAGVVRILNVGVTSLRPDDKLVTLAASGMLGDTPDFVAPELITDPDSADVRADIYSLGCTLYQLLSGEAPFSGDDFDTPMAKFEAHTTDTPRPLYELVPNISPDLAAVVHRMIARDPAQRFRSPSEIVGVMCAWANGEQLPRIVKGQLTEPGPEAGSSTISADSVETAFGQPKTSREDVLQPAPKSKLPIGWMVSLLVIGLIGGLAALGLNSLNKDTPAVADAEPGSRLSPVSKNEVIPEPSIQSDRYHTYLAEALKTQYGLTNGSWVLTPTELGNSSEATSYGHKVVQKVISGKKFANIFQLRVPKASEQPWDSAYFFPDITNISPGDSVLMVVWMRAAYPKIGEVSVFVEDPSNFNKEVYLKVEPTQEWQQFLIPFEAGPATKRSIGFHLASQRQLLEFGGLALVNYGTSVPFASLPKNLHKRSAKRVTRTPPIRTKTTAN